MKYFIFALIFICSLHGFSQTTDPAELTIEDTAAIEKRCECLQTKYDLKKEILANTTFDENGRLSIDPTLVEKRQFTFLSLKAVSEKCYQLIPKSDTEPCPEAAKFTELDDEYELILQVTEMNRMPHGDY